MCIDLIGSYLIKPLTRTKTLKAITMIHLVTSWFEVAEYKTKAASNIVHVFYNLWLTRYPRPWERVIFDDGLEFMGKI